MLVRKIFPFGTGVSPRDAINIVVLAEGFTSGQELDFYNHCWRLTNLILDTSPFQYTKIKPFWLCIFTHFKASSQAGPSIDVAPSPNRTVYESKLNTATETLELNDSLITQEVDTLTAIDHGQTVALSKLINKGKPIGENGHTLIVILTPSTGGAGGDMELLNPTMDKYAYVATTLDGHWHQVITRSLGKLLKLGDEYDLDGTTFLAPSEVQGEYLGRNYPNLFYSKDTLPTLVDNTFKWYRLLSPSERVKNLVIHSQIGASVDRNILNPAYSSDKIELWEGAGHFRKQVYRSAQDCLMRRRIGDKSISLRHQEVPFCRICQDYLFKII